MVLRAVGPFSCARVAAMLYGLIGFFAGAVIALLATFGASLPLPLAAAGDSLPMGKLIFGVGAIVILPVLYAIFGFIGGLIWAGFFNLAARMGGGLELDLR